MPEFRKSWKFGAKIPEEPSSDPDDSEEYRLGFLLARCSLL